MLISSALGVVGLALLVWGSDRFVEGAAATARNLSVSPLLIGLTIVALGTSAPEILVSGLAAWQGKTGLAIGNGIGSNIANIALVLGVAALVSPIIVRTRIFKAEFPVLLIVSGTAAWLLHDAEISRQDGITLLIGQIVVMGWIIWLTRKRAQKDPLEAEFEDEIPSDWSTPKALTWLLVGLACLLVGSNLLVNAATTIAVHFGVSDVVIGLSIVAIGTSLPELGASVASVLKGEHDIAIGNVIGSNMFNLMIVLGTAGFIGPSVFSEDVVYRDLPVMLGLTIAMVVMAFGFRKDGRINRFEATLLCLSFVAYQGWLFTSISGS